MTTMSVVGECFFWYRLTRVVPYKIHRAVKRLCVCVCCGLDAGDYEGALARLTEMIYLLQDQLSLLSSATGQHVGVFADMTTSCEILRVFLLLLLQVHIALFSSPRNQWFVFLYVDVCCSSGDLNEILHTSLV